MLRLPRTGPHAPADVNLSHPQLRGCTLWLPMNEGAGQKVRDFSGLRRDATITYTHATALLTWVHGRDPGGLAIHTEGLDPTAGPEGGYVNAPNLTITTAYVTAAEGGMSAWVSCEGTGAIATNSAFAAQTQGIITLSASSGSGGCGLYRGVLNTPVADSIFACGRNSAGTAKSIVLASVASLSAGFHHVWMSWGGGLLYGGVDGVQTASVALGGANTVTFLGSGCAISKGDSRNFGGGNQDARIYNRALSAADAYEIFAHPSAAYRPSRVYFIPSMPSTTGTPFPTVTFAEAAANRAQAWTILLTIEGIGQAEGLWKFCNRVPAYAAGAADEATYKPWLEKESWPQSLSEQVDELGGIPRCGELTASVVDKNDDLVGQLRTDQAAITTIVGDVSRTATTVVVLDGSVITLNQVIYIRNEALLVTNLAGATLTVTRAQLDTEVQAHEDGSPVFASTPYLRSRILRLRLAPHNGSADQETVLSTNYLDKVALSGDVNCWDVAGRSQLKFLARVICGQVMRYTFDSFQYLKMKLTNGVGGHDRSTHDARIWSDSVAFFKLGAEILRTNVLLPTGSTGIFTDVTSVIQERAQSGTKEDDHKPGETAYLVLNGTEPYSSFRYSPAPSPSTDRAIGTWIVASTGSGGVHFVDAILCMLTSSARLDDGYELTNYDPNYGNWSSLPPGYGIGVPYTLIDFASFIDVKARTPNWTFPNLIVGDESIPFADWVEKNFLRPLGIFMTMASGQIRLVMPRAPLVGEEATAWDFSVALRDGDTAVGLSAAPVLNTDTASSISFKLKTSLGEDVTETIGSADRAQFYSQGGYYALEENAITLDLPGARADQVGFDGFVRQLGLRRLYKLAKPRWTLRLRTDLSQYGLNPGDSVAITHPQLPDLRAGTRGWTGVLMTILEKTLSLTPAFFGFEWLLTGPGPDSARHGRVCPAANITAVAGAGPYVCTVSANRYTSPDAANGLPVIDSAGFTIGDRVRIVNRDGSAAAAVFSTVSAVGLNTVSVSSNFSGALAAGQQLIFANYGDSLGTDQATLYTFFADGTDFTIGSSDEPPYTYGE